MLYYGIYVNGNLYGVYDCEALALRIAEQLKISRQGAKVTVVSEYDDNFKI